MKIVEYIKRNNIKGVEKYKNEFNRISFDNRGEFLFKIDNFDAYIKDDNFEQTISLWDHNKIVLASVVEANNNGNIVIDITLVKRDYRGKGLAGKLYKKLIEHGYSLINNDSQSSGSEKLWARLSNDPNIHVFAVKGATIIPLHNSNDKLCLPNNVPLYSRKRIDFIIASKFDKIQINEVVTRNKISKNIDDRVDLEIDNRGEHLFDIDNYQVFLNRNFHNLDVMSIWNNHDIVAYLETKIISNEIHIKEFFIKRRYQGNSIGLKLYEKLLNLKLNIINNGSQSPGSEKLWAKLANSDDFKVFAVKRNKVIQLIGNNYKLCGIDGGSPYTGTKFIIATLNGSKSCKHYENLIKRRQ